MYRSFYQPMYRPLYRPHLQEQYAEEGRHPRHRQVVIHRLIDRQALHQCGCQGDGGDCGRLGEGQGER